MDSLREISYSRLHQMPQTLKPHALSPGDSVRILSLSSPVDEHRLERGREEIARLGYSPVFDREQVLASESFFAGSPASRLCALKTALAEPATRAIICSRGGYGSNYLLDGLSIALASPKIVLGFSDVTSLLILLWQKFRWVTFHGPMVAAGLHKGAAAEEGYDRPSLLRAITETREGWKIGLEGEPLSAGEAKGILLGGCLTLVEATLGTPWELDTQGAILILEDRGMKPYQVDRSLMHLKQAGKFRGVAGVVLGDFPDCEAAPGAESVKDVARRILGPLEIPVFWGAPIGHTKRPALTLPLGVRASLSVTDRGGTSSDLEILEPAVVA